MKDAMMLGAVKQVKIGVLSVCTSKFAPSSKLPHNEWSSLSKYLQAKISINQNKKMCCGPYLKKLNLASGKNLSSVSTSK